ncbi:MAG TPA: DUF4337 family protein [Kofleriaceae bacterium]|jgi:hypothetical protein
MDAHEALEHAEHAAHAGHGHGHDEGHGPAKGKSKLGMFVGMTMGLLGVLLALAAAKVGGERTELVESMVDQQSANSRYQSQDVKHRMAFLALSQIHAMMPTPEQVAAGAHEPVKADVVELGRTVQRYFKEATLAKAWSEAYDPVIKTHIEAQEHYETGQLLAEIGIVLASIALLLQKRLAWFLSMGLGAGAIIVLALTRMHTGHEVEESEEKIAEAGKLYRDTRNADKTTASEDALVASVFKWAGAPLELPGAPAAAHE